MQADGQPLWHAYNRYSADAACEHCSGITRHERWCACVNHAVAYAFYAARGAVDLEPRDRILLHSWGVAWEPRQD